MNAKKKIIVGCLLLLVNSVISAQSTISANADYIRTLNRNATTDSIDAAIFNPAGITGLIDGIHLHIGNQFGFFGLPLPGSPNPQPSFGLLDPDLILVYKRAGYGLYFTVTSPSYSYNKAEGEIIDSSLTQNYSDSHRTLEVTAGSSLTLWDFLSLSFGIRGLYENNNKNYTYMQLSGGSTIIEDYQDKSNGFGIGVQAGVTMKWDWVGLSFNYKSEVATFIKHDITSTITQGSISPPPSAGQNQNQSTVKQSFSLHPSELKVGLVFDIGRHFSLQSSFDVVLQHEVVYIPESDINSDIIVFDGLTNSYHVGLGFDHKINSSIKWGLGVRYNFDGDNSGLLLGTGASFLIKDNVEIKPSFLFPLVFSDFEDHKMDFHFNLGVTVHFQRFRN